MYFSELMQKMSTFCKALITNSCAIFSLENQQSYIYSSVSYGAVFIIY